MKKLLSLFCIISFFLIGISRAGELRRRAPHSKAVRHPRNCPDYNKNILKQLEANYANLYNARDNSDIIDRLARNVQEDKISVLSYCLSGTVVYVGGFACMLVGRDQEHSNIFIDSPLQAFGAACCFSGLPLLWCCCIHYDQYLKSKELLRYKQKLR